MMRSLPLAAAAVLLSAVSAMAQSDRGTITGTVTDQSGAAVPGVQVTLKHIGTGESIPMRTNEVGQYSRPNLAPGDYQVVFEAQWFKRAIRSGITLKVTDVLRVDAKLELGAVADAIEVSAEAARI